MSGGPWTSDPVVAARLERLNDAYARGEIDLDDLERRTVEIIELGHWPPKRNTPTQPAAVPTPSTRAQADAGFYTSPRNRALLAALIIVIVIGGLGALVSSTTNAKIVPDAVGMYPQEAIAAINAAGVRTNSHGGIHEQEGQGFVVCETVPAAGTPLDADDAVVESFSRRDCEPKSALAKAYLREWRASERAANDVEN